jgi:glycine cleavage system H protein
MYPTDRLYTKEHEWIMISGATARVGITDYAQGQLGDVVYVELPGVGQQFEPGAQFGSIESVKAVSDLYCPMAGTVVEVNTTLVDRPETVNADPHGAWIIAIELTSPDQTAGLIDATAYAELVS